MKRCPCAHPVCDADPERGHVYFVRSGQHVKIGYSKTPLSRLVAIRTACPEPVVPLALVPACTKRTEANLHRRFAELRGNGEWFRNEGELAAFLASPEMSKWAWSRGPT